MDLYRYRSVDEWSIQGIERNEFFFASPADFNDPFDCKNLFTFKGATNSDWRIYLTNYAINQMPHLTELQRREFVDRIIRSGEHRSREMIAEQGDRWGKILEEHSRNLGIVCLSKVKDDILMWSHYGNDHKGFCLRFNADMLGEISSCYPVKYRKRYPTFGEFVRSDLEKIANLFVQTKSNHWKYEKEVRLIRNAITPSGEELGRVIKYPKQALTGIIFGCLASDEVKQRIASAVAVNGVRVQYYQSVKSRDSYSVEVVAI